MELADLVVINKADLDRDAATRAEAQITSALRLFGMHGHPDRTIEFWRPTVIQISALLGQGVDAFWQQVSRYRTLQTANGRLAARRQQQSLAWMWERIESGLRQHFRSQPGVRELLPRLTEQVVQGQLPASTAARQLLAAASAPDPN
jgi:LAO/AO transport system kinase